MESRRGICIKSKVKDDDEVVTISASQTDPYIVPTFGRAILLLCSAINYGVGIGIPITLSVMFLEWQETFKTSRALTASIHSTCVGILFGGGIAAGYIMKRFGPRTTLTLGSALASVGLFLAVYAPNVELMICSVGIVSGCGFCLLQLPCIPCCTRAFPKYQSLAIATCPIGFSIIGALLPYLLQYLTDVYSWRGTFFILSSLTLNTMVSGLMMTSFVGKVQSSRERAKLMADADIDPASLALNKRTSTSNGILEKEVNVLNCQSREENLYGYQKKGTEVKPGSDADNCDGRTVATKQSTQGLSYLEDLTINGDIMTTEHREVAKECIECEELVSNSHEEEVASNDDTSRSLNIKTTSIDPATRASTAINSQDNQDLYMQTNLENPRHFGGDALINSATNIELPQRRSVVTDSDTLLEKSLANTDNSAPPFVSSAQLAAGHSAATDAGTLQEKTVLKFDGNISPFVCSVNLSEQVGILHRLRVSSWRFLLNALSQGIMLVIAFGLGSLISTVILLMDISKTKGFPNLGITLIQLTLITSLAAKVITGALGMMRRLPSYLLLAFCGAGGGGSALLIAFSQQEMGLIVGACGVGLFFGGIVTVYPKCFLDSSAIDEINFPLALGVGSSCEGIIEVLFPIFIGYMADRTGAYTLPLSLVGVSSILCAIILAVVYFWTRTKFKDKNSVDGF